MADTLQTDATGWVPTYFDGFDGGWMQFYTTWGNRYQGQHANGAFSYNRDLVSIDNSMLTVTNARTATGWESGGVDQGFNGQRYGKYEIRARVEDGQGTSGAIILWPNSGRWPPEVDIMESPSADRSSTYFFYHGLEGTGGGQFSVDASEWHTYTLEWTPGKLTWSVDGQLLAETKSWESSWVPDEPMTLAFTGFVASGSDVWWGTPNETTPERVNMYVDYVNISAIPLGSRDQVAPSAFDGAAAPPAVAVGPAAIGGQLYAAAINNGDWGTVGTVRAAPTEWGANFADRMAWTNVNQVQLDLHAAGSTSLDIMLLDVKGGTVTTGSGNDVVAWVAYSDAAGTGNTLLIDSGAGNDAVRVGPAGWIGLDDSFLHGAAVDPWYQGENSIATVSLGAGDDMVLAVGLVRLHANGGTGNDLLVGGASDDTLEGGAGDDTLQGGQGTDYAFFGATRDHFTITTDSWGGTIVTDTTGALGTDHLTGIERLAFLDVTIDLETGAPTTDPTQPPPPDSGGTPPPAGPGPTTPPTSSGDVTLGSGPDALVLLVSQDAYQGSAQYTVSVDGVQVGGTQTAVALHGSGHDTVTLQGAWGTGPHTVSVDFLNDAWDGTASTDRNLYVEGMTYNGTAVSGGNAALMSEGPVSFGFGSTTTPTSPPPGGLPQPANGGQFIQGTDQVDQLVGTAGDDVILAGRGNDGITGGDGADSFVFRPGDGPDWLNDFTSGQDHLVFQGLTRADISWHDQSYGLPGVEVTYGGDSVFLAGAWALRESDLVFV